MQVIVKNSIKYNGKRSRPGAEIEMDDKIAEDLIARGLVAAKGEDAAKTEVEHVSPTKKAREERRAQSAKVEAPAEGIVTVESDIEPENAGDLLGKGKGKGGKAKE